MKIVKVLFKISFKLSKSFTDILELIFARLCVFGCKIWSSIDLFICIEEKAIF